MKRFTTSLALVFALVFVFGAVNAVDEAAWFDMQNCDMCAPMMAEKGLMRNITWESHSLSNGMISIAKASDSHAAAFDRACASMDELGKELKEGKEMTLCGHCKSYSSLMSYGANVEKVITKLGHVTLFTSSDEKTVEKIHAHLERANVESEKMAKMMEAQMKKAGHEGHSHD